MSIEAIHDLPEICYPSYLPQCKAVTIGHIDYAVDPNLLAWTVAQAAQYTARDSAAEPSGHELVAISQLIAIGATLLSAVMELDNINPAPYLKEAQETHAACKPA